MKKIIIAVIAAVLVIIALSCILIYAAYDRYGFLFELDEDQQYSVKIAKYDSDGYYSYEGSRFMGDNSRNFYRALKESNYRFVGDQLSTELDHGELALIFVRDSKGEVVKNTEFYLYYETEKEKLYLWWRNSLYEVSDFEEGRHIIQTSTYTIAQEGIIDEEEKTFYPMPYFTNINEDDAYKYENHKNTTSVTLSSDQEIIEHARNEVPEGYKEAQVYREDHGDRYMVRYEYTFKENNIAQYIYVIMSADGITEVVQHKIFHMTKCM